MADCFSWPVGKTSGPVPRHTVSLYVSADARLTPVWESGHESSSGLVMDGREVITLRHPRLVDALALSRLGNLIRLDLGLPLGVLFPCRTQQEKEEKPDPA